MNRSLCTIAAGFAFAGLASTASADCDVARLIAVPATVSADYDGFAPSDVTVPLLGRSTRAVDCVGSRVTFELRSLEGRLLGSGEGLELRSGSQTLVASLSGEDTAAGARFDRQIESRLDGVGALPLDGLNLVLARGQRVPPGVYEGQFRLSAEVFDEQGATVAQGESVVAVAMQVQPSVGLSAAWGTELDLGTIAANGRAAAPLRLRAYANTGYEITLTSDNGFGLIRPGTRVGRPIAYAPILSGETLSEGAERRKTFQTPDLAAGFSDHTLDVVVPALTLQPAGDYQDFITVTIRPALS